MKKVITSVGNSAAIILDRAICEIMGIERGSIVRLSFQGTKLVMERTGQAKAERPQKPTVAPKLETVADSKESIVEPELDENDEYTMPVLARYHRDVALELFRSRDLHHADVPRIDPRLPEGLSYATAVVGLQNAMGERPSAQGIVVARRVRFIWDFSKDHSSWKKLIDEAVERYPWPTSSVDMSTGSGADAATTPPSGCGNATRAA